MARTDVPSTVARALRMSAGSRTKTSVPAGASSSSVHREDGMPGDHREQLLVAVRQVGLVVALVMRLDQLVARVPGDGVHSEGADVEVPADHVEVPVRPVGILREDVGRHLDVGEVHCSVRRRPWIGHGR